MGTMPEISEIREYTTEYLDAELTAAFDAIGTLNTQVDISKIEGRNRKMWQAYRNRLLRIADARDSSRYYRWFDEHSLDVEVE